MTTEAQQWITIATVDEVPPGERLVVEIGRKWVAVFNINGVYYAIEDVCTHDDGPLAEGELTGTTIECPRHGACFDVSTGKVLSAPAVVDASTYHVRVQGADLQVQSH
ncbi:MAG: non-heme iron oxygenase ferredoxin subunit [Anaerolineae bacterium]|nr:non-heme iron oxygenase ferredoxin subunit [Anaerolineae bacterium]